MNHEIHTWTQEKPRTQTLSTFYQSKLSSLHSDGPSPLRIFSWLNHPTAGLHWLLHKVVDLYLYSAVSCIYMSKNASLHICLPTTNVKLIESRKRIFCLCFVLYKGPTETFNNAWSNLQVVNSVIPAITSNWIYVMLFSQRAPETANNKTTQ